MHAFFFKIKYNFKEQEVRLPVVTCASNHILMTKKLTKIIPSFVMRVKVNIKNVIENKKYRTGYKSCIT